MLHHAVTHMCYCRVCCCCTLQEGVGDLSDGPNYNGGNEPYDSVWVSEQQALVQLLPAGNTCQHNTLTLLMCTSAPYSSRRLHSFNHMCI
jgi:hypothetical protein